MKWSVLAALAWSAAFMVAVHGPHRPVDWVIAIGGGVMCGLIVLELQAPDGAATARRPQRSGAAGEGGSAKTAEDAGDHEC